MFLNFMLRCRDVTHVKSNIIKKKLELLKVFYCYLFYFFDEDFLAKAFIVGGPGIILLLDTSLVLCVGADFLNFYLIVKRLEI